MVNKFVVPGIHVGAQEAGFHKGNASGNHKGNYEGAGSKGSWRPIAVKEVRTPMLAAKNSWSPRSLLMITTWLLHKEPAQSEAGAGAQKTIGRRRREAGSGNQRRCIS